MQHCLNRSTDRIHSHTTPIVYLYVSEAKSDFLEKQCWCHLVCPLCHSVFFFLLSWTKLVRGLLSYFSNQDFQLLAVGHNRKNTGMCLKNIQDRHYNVSCDVYYFTFLRLVFLRWRRFWSGWEGLVGESEPPPSWPHSVAAIALLRERPRERRHTWTSRSSPMSCRKQTCRFGSPQETPNQSWRKEDMAARIASYY